MAGLIWTQEKLQALALAELKSLRQNAIGRGVSELVALCDAELARRPNASRSAKPRSRSKAEHGEIVLEYHFVCRNDRGVSQNSDGTFWSASWVVAEDVLKRSMEHGARLALHESKTEPSYRQGLITAYKRIDDFEDGEVSSRIDFLVTPEPTPIEWSGAGTGEKGYKRAKLSQTLSSNQSHEI